MSNVGSELIDLALVVNLSTISAASSASESTVLGLEATHSEILGS